MSELHDDLKVKLLEANNNISTLIDEIIALKRIAEGDDCCNYHLHPMCKDCNECKEACYKNMKEEMQKKYIV